MNNDDSDYTVETIETLEEFEKLREDWLRLFNLKKDVSIFFSFDVFKIYYETTLNDYKNVKMKIFVVKNKNLKIVAILPFSFENKRYYHFLPVKELLLKDNLLGFYSFFVDIQEDYEAILNSIINYLKESKESWDIMRFYHIPENEKLFKVCVSTFSQYYKSEISEANALVVNCNRKFNEYIKTDMRKHFVKETKRQIRRLKEMGELKLVEIKDEQEIEKGLKFFYDIENSNWKGRMKTSLKYIPCGVFYKKLALHLSRENKIRIYFLQLKDQYIAGLYTIIDREICYLQKAGYDDDFYRYSPSNVLYYLLFEKLFINETPNCSKLLHGISCPRLTSDIVMKHSSRPLPIGMHPIEKIDFFGPYYQYERNFGGETRKRYSFFVYNNNLPTRAIFFFKKSIKKFFKIEGFS